MDSPQAPPHGRRAVHQPHVLQGQSQTRPDIFVVGRPRDSHFHVFDGLFELPTVGVQQPQAIVNVHVLRLQLQSALVCLDRVVVLAELLLGDAQLDDRLHVAAVDVDRRPELLHRLAQPALAAKQHSVAIPHVGPPWVPADLLGVALGLLVEQVVVVQADLSHWSFLAALEALDELLTHRCLEL